MNSEAGTSIEPVITKVTFIDKLKTGLRKTGAIFSRQLHRGHVDDLEKDPLWNTMGDVGFWQVLVTIVMTLFNMPATLQLIAPEVEAMESRWLTGGDSNTFLSTNYWCRRPASLRNISVEEWIELSGISRPGMNGGLEYNPCKIKNLDYSLPYSEIKTAVADGEVDCLVWEYAKDWWTVIAQFNLACSKLPINTISESVFSCGAAFTGTFMGLMADKFGRRVIMMSSQFILLLSGFIIALVPSYTSYLILRTVLGVVSSALFSSCSVLCIEVSAHKWQSTMSLIYVLSCGLGYFTLAAIALVLTRWDHLQFIISIISIITLSFWWFLPESPRWLLVKKRIDRIVTIIETAASLNGKPIPMDTVTNIRKMPVVNDRSKNRVKLKMLFTTPTMKYLSTITPFIFFFTSIAYYGLTFRQVALFSVSDTLHVLMIKGMLEIVATITALVLPYSSEILNTVIIVMIEGILCLASAIWPSLSQTSFILFTASRFFASLANTTLSMTIANYYPTMIRMTGLGWGYTGEGLGLLVAVNIVNLGRIAEYWPPVFYGSSACIGSVLIFFLPNEVYTGRYDLIKEMEKAYASIEQDTSRTRKTIKKKRKTTEYTFEDMLNDDKYSWIHDLGGEDHSRMGSSVDVGKAKSKTSWFR